MDLGMIRKVDIDSEMQHSYLDYAMSVIVARALPDARDGLKPVQRRILYSMYDMGIRAESAYKKSARIVGEVLGKYHPHGDMAVYEAMARLAQEFTMRYPLIDGQGNFGSVDGDPPAAMRYTEARLAAFSGELLSQIDRDTVDFIRNFDDTLNEPIVLPASIPNLLVNGANGIAVGMATNIPPHNLGEVVDALVHLLQHWEKLDDINIEVLMHYIQGPDFPTGGIILQEKEVNQLQSAYATGKGRVTLRGKVHSEEMARGRNRLIITELPYSVNKASLIERIAELVRENRLEGLADLRDESDRQGMRIVIELKQGVDQEAILRALYQHTPMQTTFGINLLALVDDEPRLLTLKQALKIFIEHRLIVIRRRSEFDLKQAREKAHVLEGLRIAIRHLDEIIRLIRSSMDSEQAKIKLMKKFKLSQIQAQAILDMPFKRLAALERKKIEDEYKEWVTKIKELEGLLRSTKKIRQIAVEELILVKNKYPDRRRTQIASLRKGEKSTELLTAMDLTPVMQTSVSITRDGLIARSHAPGFPKLTGKQVPDWLVKTDTHSTLYMIDKNGMAVALAVHALPEAERPSDGTEINRIAPTDGIELPSTVIAIPPRTQQTEDQFLVVVSKQGMIKKSSLQDLPGVSSQQISIAKVNNGDTLAFSFLTDGEDEILLITKKGLAIRFHDRDVRPMGLITSGVNGIKLGAGDEIIAAEKIGKKNQVTIIDSSGKVWRISESEYPIQGRYGRGVSACKLVSGSELVSGCVDSKNHIVYIRTKKKCTYSFKISEVALGKRTKLGQPLFLINPGDEIDDVVTIRLDQDLGNRGKRPRKDRKTTRSITTTTSKKAKSKMRTEKSRSRKAVVTSSSRSRKSKTVRTSPSNIMTTASKGVGKTAGKARTKKRGRPRKVK
jgi:DNA gyrase subunit A